MYLATNNTSTTIQADLLLTMSITELIFELLKVIIIF